MNIEITERSRASEPRRFDAQGSLWVAWIPGVMPVLVAIGLGGRLPDWVWMWVLALALILGAKWITLSAVRGGQTKIKRWRLLAYVFLWPGMDARRFLNDSNSAPPPIEEWILAAGKMLFGGGLLWAATRLVGPGHPLVTGWVGMIGIGFVLHLGRFHGPSLFWRALGIEARPIMRSPGTATSLSEFWGGRWNAAFSDLVRGHLFKPLARHLGARGALFTIFLFSGVVHEIVISLPARGGYGLPTAYFLLQGLGLLIERSSIGWRLGLGAGWKGWCSGALGAGGPAVCVFP